MALVLVVDDEPAFREFVREILENDGHSVVEARDGKEGLWMFREVRPDLVMVDLFMPVKDGVETIREIRAANRDIGIIAVSGGGAYGIRDILADMVSLGATSTLAKPFEPAELLTAVTRALRRGPPPSPGSRTDPNTPKP